MSSVLYKKVLIVKKVYKKHYLFSEIFANFKNMQYLCSVFFMVLDF